MFVPKNSSAYGCCPSTCRPLLDCPACSGSDKIGGDADIHSRSERLVPAKKGRWVTCPRSTASIPQGKYRPPVSVQRSSRLVGWLIYCGCSTWYEGTCFPLQNAVSERFFCVDFSLSRSLTFLSSYSRTTALLSRSIRGNAHQAANFTVKNVDVHGVRHRLFFGCFLCT